MSITAGVGTRVFATPLATRPCPLTPVVTPEPTIFPNTAHPVALPLVKIPVGACPAEQSVGNVASAVAVAALPLVLAGKGAGRVRLGRMPVTTLVPPARLMAPLAMVPPPPPSTGCPAVSPVPDTFPVPVPHVPAS